MQYDLNNKQHLLEIEASLIPSHLSETLGEQESHRLAEASLAQLDPFFSSYDFANKMKDFCKVPSAKAEDFFLRVLQLDEQRQVITSYRALGGDTNNVFIQIMYMNFELSSTKQALELAQEVAPHYAKFNPLRIRFFSKSAPAYADGENVWGDQHFLTAHHTQLKQLDIPAALQLEVVAATDITWYEQYKEACASALRAQPELKEVVWINSAEEMQELVDKAPIFSIMIEGQWAGVIAVERSTERFFSGYCMMEIALKEEFRGNGYAAFAQSEMFKKLKWEEHDIIWGTIGTENLPSIRTAQKCGRQLSGSYYFAKV